MYRAIKEGFGCLATIALCGGIFYGGTVFKGQMDKLPIIGKDYEVIETKEGNKYYDKNKDKIYDLNNIEKIQDENKLLKSKIKQIDELFKEIGKEVNSDETIDNKF